MTKPQNMHPQSGLIMDEDGQVYSLVKLIKSVGSGSSREIEFQTNATHIQWKYTDETTWKDVVALADLGGASSAAVEQLQHEVKNIKDNMLSYSVK